MCICMCQTLLSREVSSTLLLRNFINSLSTLSFLALLTCAKLSFLSLAEQCPTKFCLDCTGNISAVPEQNFIRFQILDNSANVNHVLTFIHDLCTLHVHLKLMCTGHFSAVPGRNLRKFQTLLLQTTLKIYKLQNMFCAQFVHA